MAAAIPFIIPQWSDNNGKPLSGGKLWTYQSGTTIPIASYTDSTGLIPNTNPVILDGGGRAAVFLAPGSYKIVLMDKNDNVIWTQDKIKPADGGGGGIVDSDYSFNEWSARFNEQFTSTGLMDTLTKIIKPQYVGPGITLSMSGSGTIREKGVSFSSTIMTAALAKRSNPLGAVRFYRGVTLLDTQTSGGGIPSGGNSTYTYATSFSDTTSFTAQVDDTVVGGNGPTTTTSNTVTFSFVYPYYRGVGAAGLNAAGIQALTKDVITSSNSLNRSFTVSGTQKMYFAYPASYGDLTAILDVSSFNTLPDWTKTTKSFTMADSSSQNYTCYEFNNFAVAGTYSYTFVR